MKKRLTLKDLGAEKCINLLQPIRCECGCGNYGELVLETTQDVVDFAGTLLEDVDCEHAYIFALTRHGVAGAFTDESGVHAFIMADEHGDEIQMDFDEQIEVIKHIIQESEPHCVGCIQHTKNNRYRIVMETIYDRKEKNNGKTNNRRY